VEVVNPMEVEVVDAMNDSLRARVRESDPTRGTFLSLGSALAAEACALAGFDWLLADLEHGGGDEGQLLNQILAASSHAVPVIVRVESAERIRAGRALDLGAAGVMFPRLDTADQVAAALRHLRYPPEGDRGVATANRARGFGSDSDFRSANESVLGVVQIESVGALEGVESIAGLAGVDVIFVGPQDLSHALGVPGNLDAPEFCAAVRRVSRAAHHAGIAAGILVGGIDAASRYAEEGFGFIGVGSDASFVAAGARSAAGPLRVGV
jgi:2-keto-3-deoxy-L-rhamnonate aldolase RhmA